MLVPSRLENMSVLSRFESIPDELLEDIALAAVESSFLGPPIELLALLCLSRTISKKLSMDRNPYLYARIFCSKFDVCAAVRRLGADCARARQLTEELVRRCNGLKRLRRDAYPRNVQGDALDGGLRVDLWMAYLMFLESDGKNARQVVQYARIDRLAFKFVRPGGRLHDGAQENEGWTVDSEANALGTWLFWFTDNERVQSESPTERDQILEALGCFYTGSFKYASAHAPLTSFRIPPATQPPLLLPLSIFPLSASPTPPPCTVPSHFGLALTLARPLSSTPALLACVGRLGGSTDGMPRGSEALAMGAEAVRMDWTRATGEDLAAFERQGKGNLEWFRQGSGRLEHDWRRLLTCYNPWSQPRVTNRVFTPGMLDGVWEGRWLTIPPDFFQYLLLTTEAYENVSTPLHPPIIQQLMQFRLREHHQYDRGDMVEFDDMSSDGVGRGALRAWLPNGTNTMEQQGELHVYNPTKKVPSRYQTFDRAQATLDEELPRDAGLYGGGVWDVILTAETEAEFTAARGHDHYVGRVRDWDGLVVLVREARPGAGRWVFRGYVHGGRNLVGRWRETGTQVDVPGWEGVWSMVKVPA